ncbi:glycoside hydrolase family 95 protein [Plicaturopsis crispa FD-325 SS-3]|nr:glycoside hydrolase family 95 protein [Plicaturopsis crispa FD-325 SS-3]
MLFEPFFYLVSLLTFYTKSWLEQTTSFLSGTDTETGAERALVGNVSVPEGFPKSGNGLWYISPGMIWAKDYLPIGNGYLAAMVPGGTVYEVTQFNIESLWSGGPFADATYNGGNSPPSDRSVLAADTQDIRHTIFANDNGTIDNIEELATPAGAYGSYIGAGYLINTLNTLNTLTPTTTTTQQPTQIKNYTRWLDLDIGVARTAWTVGNQSFMRESFCSHPAQACVQHLSLSTNLSTHNTHTNDTNAALPTHTYAFAYSLNGTAGLNVNVTCWDETTLRLRGTAGSPGMVYEVLGRVFVSGGDASVSCAPVQSATPVSVQNANANFQSEATVTMQNANATVTVQNATTSWILWVGGTEFDQAAGNAAHNFTFRGPDPHDALVALLSADTTGEGEGDYKEADYTSLRAAHVADITALQSGFRLNITGDFDVATLRPTDELMRAYRTDVGDPYRTDIGDPWVEQVLFNYGRYLLGGSARGVLPANLQGKWAEGGSSAWSADYHANINLQMNYWAAETTGLDVTQSLWNYLEASTQNWAPRGAETAQILYNISRGWVTHNEMNIFGHTGMKLSGNSAQWADYPESAVWMMIHVWDHFDYTNDVTWWKAQGWPLLKAVASFHLDKLILDLHFNDSSLVTAPCNSPEQTPITFGCAHAQQLIWQALNAVEKGFEASGDTDTAFLAEVRAKRDKMDKGIRIGSWGQLQEWKVDMDSPTDTHRHLSHLIGLYPGYAVAGYNSTIQPVPNLNASNINTTLNYTLHDVLGAAQTSLIHRGNGTGPDADAGWEKVWRAAAWAQLGNASEFYHELSYAIQRNFGDNMFSLYDPDSSDSIFQIDANLGYPAAVINALISAPDTASLSTPLTVTLLPAVPTQWPSGTVTGTRLRGGWTVDLAWSGGKPTSAVFTAKNATRPVRVVYGGKVVGRFDGAVGGTISF